MERRIDLHLRISYAPRVLRPWLALCILLLCAGELGSENVTLTTYYPAPSGMYTQMVVTGNTWLARDSGKVGVGTAAPLDTLHVVGGIRSAGSAADYNTGDQVTLDWNAGDARLNAQKNGGGSATLSLLTQGATRIFVAVGGNVGIGTSLPASKLDVSGGSVHIDASAYCTAQDFTDTVSCGGGLYATFTPGIYHEGWSYNNRGGAVLVEGAAGEFSTQVWGMDSTGNPRWMTLKKDDSMTRAYCCTK